MNAKSILCVITGMEQSGTTYLSKLLASDPEIMCGFECGLLLKDIGRFPEVKPWFEWMQLTTAIGHWGVQPENMGNICMADDYYEAYRLIKNYAGELGPPQVKKCFQNARYIIDKTPRYAYFLDQIMGKIDVPFVVIRKALEAQYTSHKKRKIALHKFLPNYHMCRYALEKACDQYPDRLLVVNYEDLLTDERGVLEKIYAFLNKPIPESLSLEAFFERTGLSENTFVNESGGMKKNFSSKNLKVGLTKNERIILKIYDLFHSFIPSGLIRQAVNKA